MKIGLKPENSWVETSGLRIKLGRANFIQATAIGHKGTWVVGKVRLVIFGPKFHRKPINGKTSGSSWNINECACKEWRRTIILIVRRVIPPVGTDGCRGFPPKSLGRHCYPVFLAKPDRECGIESLLYPVYRAIFGVAVMMK